MRTKTVEQVVKHSLVYGYAITQPFLLNVNSTLLLDEHELEASIHKENSEVIHHIGEHHSYQTKELTVSYNLPKEKATNGVQSSHEIEADQETVDAMRQEIKEEKTAVFKKLQTEINAIQFGESGEQVEKIQDALAHHDYYKGEIDGIYGPLTETALKQAEEDNILPSQVQSTEEKQEPLVQTEKQDALEETKIESENEKEDEQPEETVSLNVSNPSSVIQEAKQFIGTPYEWGGTSPSGFDCSGFIQYVYDQDNQTLPRTVREIWNYGDVTESPSIGDLVFFETYQAGPSHLGIYLGNGDFIHAGSSSGVTISNYKENTYWQEKYLGAKTIN